MAGGNIGSGLTYPSPASAEGATAPIFSFHRMTLVSERSRGGGPTQPAKPAEEDCRHVSLGSPSGRLRRGPLCASSEARHGELRPPGIRPTHKVVDT